MADSDNTTRGQRIRDLRLTQGMTINAVASECCVSPTYIGLIERDVRNPGRSLLFRLSAALEASVQFIETGEPSPEDQARIGRGRLWAEIIYLIANHVIVPMRFDPQDFLPDNDDLITATRKSYELPHLREYRAWARSRTGRKTGDRIRETGVIQELLDSVFGGIPIGGAYIGDPGWWARFSDRTLSRLNAHSWAKNSKRDPASRHPAAGFAYDITMTYWLYGWLPFPWINPGDYNRNVFRDEFVNAAFPDIFWSAKCHSGIA